MHTNMHTNKGIPEPWLFFLRELDSAVREEVRLDCMGGFVISMVYGFSRPTASATEVNAQKPAARGSTSSWC
jgi:hypothetical protein